MPLAAIAVAALILATGRTPSRRRIRTVRTPATSAGHAVRPREGRC